MKQLLFMLLAMTLISCTRDAPTTDLPVLGRDAVKVEEVETLQEGLNGLGASGVRGASLVLLFSRSGFLDADIRKLISQKAEGGIISRVIWAIPEPVLTDFVLAEGQLRGYALSLDALPKAEVGEMKHREGCLTGIISGVRMDLCNSSNLPFIKGPVLLSAETGFFVDYADSRSINKLSTVHSVFKSVFKRKYSVAEAVFSYGVMDGFTRPIHRYVGEAAAWVITSPRMLSLKPPEHWAVRGDAEILFVQGDHERLSEHVRDALAKYPGDPDILLINAAAMLRQGEAQEEVITEAETLCKRNAAYCIGLQYLGYLARMDGKDDIAAALEASAQLHTTLPERLHYGRQADEGKQKEPDSN